MEKPVIIFENDDFVVVNKPSGLLSIPDRLQSGDSLKSFLQKKYGQIFTVHRLDKDTSGLIAFAKNEHAHKFLSQAFEERLVDKNYLGIVYGPIIEHPAKNGLMVVNKKGKPAITHYRVLEELGSFSYLSFNIETGRTHQIRLHMQSIGHSIVCDSLYGNETPIFVSSFKRNYKLSKLEEEERPILQRLGLHSFQLKFKDRQNREQQFEAALPKDMKALLQQLRNNAR